MIPFYSRAGLRKDREERGTTPSQPIQMAAVDARVPDWVSADAPYIEPEKTIHVFDAKTGRFIPHQQWLATVPIERDEVPRSPIPVGAANCNGQRGALITATTTALLFESNAPNKEWRAEDKQRRADVSTAECDGELTAGRQPEGYR